MRLSALTVLVLVTACGGSGGGNSQGSGTPPPPDNTVTPIYEIQGSGATSPLDGQAVTAQGIVTGDFQDGDADDSRNLGGFYVQGAADGNAATSDGIFIFDGNSPSTDVKAGDIVRVEGTVKEFFGETQLDPSADGGSATALAQV